MPKEWDQIAELKPRTDHSYMLVKPHGAISLQRKRRYIWKLSKENIICHAATQDMQCQKRHKDDQTLVSGKILFSEWLSFQAQFFFCSILVPGHPALVAMLGKCLCSLSI